MNLSNIFLVYADRILCSEVRIFKSETPEDPGGVRTKTLNFYLRGTNHIKFHNGLLNYIFDTLNLKINSYDL